MADLHDQSVTEAVNAGMEQILKASATVDDRFGQLKVLTSAAALLLELAKRSFGSMAVGAAFYTSKREMVAARRQAQRTQN